MKKYKQRKETLSKISKLFTEMAAFNIPVEIMKEFLGELKTSYTSPNESKDYISTILDFLVQMVRTNTPKEVFVFYGEQQSGICLVALKNLPKEGYGFFGWIRIERKPQNATETSRIFQLSVYKDKDISFSIKENCFYYSVSDKKGKDSHFKVWFSQKKLEEDQWIFVELYHINVESPRNLVITYLKLIVIICKWSIGT